MKKYLFGLLYGLLLVAFTAYVLLDTFVITRVYQPVPADGGGNAILNEGSDNPNASSEIGNNSSSGHDTQPPSEPVLSENTYSDEHISITITEYRENDTTIYVADVQISSPEYLKTAFAENAYGRNITQKTSEIADNNGAILAINGDYYGAQERGYVVRNGVLYRDSTSRNQEDLVIYADGSFEIIEEGAVSAETLLDDGAQQILSFGPALVMDGRVSVTEDEEVGKARSSNPRTAIGIIEECHYLFVVSDGRTEESDGLSLMELAAFMQELGVTTAYNLDGGGSSTMYFGGEVINNPTTSGSRIKERSVSDIVYIGY